MSLPTAVSPRPSDLDWRWALPRIAVLFVATRLLVLLVAIAVETTQPAQPGIGDARPIITSLTVWDGEWFLGLAEHGYPADPEQGLDYAFYPLYPATVKAATALTLGDTELAGILVANVAFVVALLALYALSIRYLTPRQSLWSLWFLAMAPGAAAFTMSYSDSLFLLLVVTTFLAAETRHPWIAGITLALATLTRAPGLLLALPLLVLYIERDGLRPTRSWVPLLLAPLALGGFFAYTWWLTGDPLAPISAYSYWDPPEVPAGPAGEGASLLAAGVSEPREEALSRTAAAIWIGSAIFYLFLFVYFRHSPIRPAYWLVAILAVAGILLAGQLQSAPRYLVVAWPFAWALACRQSQIGRSAVLIAMAALQAVLLWLHFTWSMPP